MAKKKEDPKGIKIELVKDGAKLPQKACYGSIAFDVYCPEDTFVPKGRSIIKTGFCMELPLGIEGKIEPRSGFSLKGFEGCAVIRKNPNSFNTIDDFAWDRSKTTRFDCDVTVGKVDPFYTDEVGVIVKNNGSPFVCPKGTRIAQLTLYYSDPNFTLIQVDKIDRSQSRGGGFGHTGTK